MLITKEQQEALLDTYAKEGHTIDQCVGFVDGMVRLIELLIKIEANKIKPLS